MWSIFDILHKNFQKDQLYSRRFLGVVDTLYLINEYDNNDDDDDEEPILLCAVQSAKMSNMDLSELFSSPHAETVCRSSTIMPSWYFTISSSSALCDCKLRTSRLNAICAWTMHNVISQYCFKNVKKSTALNDTPSQSYRT